MYYIIEMFAQLPRLFEELQKRPIRTTAFLLLCVLVSVVVVMNVPKREQKPKQAVETQEPERRITKIAKWLWEKE